MTRAQWRTIAVARRQPGSTQHRIATLLEIGDVTAGRMIDPGQTLTRAEALRLWTAANGWFTFEEDKVGSIEPGKLADLVVLSRDFLDPAQVPDEDIRKLTSLMTMVGGRVVHGTAGFR